jgi:uncharacterized protein (TIGR02246 family)
MTLAAVAVDAAVDVQIRHLIARYVWALDTGDIEGLMTLFTDDCVVQDTSGRRHEGKAAAEAYFAMLTRIPQFRGRRHHIDNLVYLRCDDECRLRAYWTVAKWEATTQLKVIEFMGHSEDRFVQRDGQWRFAERLLHYWRDVDGPWTPSGP